jgi:hypothetical protein
MVQPSDQTRPRELFAKRGELAAVHRRPRCEQLNDSNWKVIDGRDHELVIFPRNRTRHFRCRYNGFAKRQGGNDFGCHAVGKRHGRNHQVCPPEIRPEIIDKA